MNEICLHIYNLPIWLWWLEGIIKVCKISAILHFSVKPTCGYLQADSAKYWDIRIKDPKKGFSEEDFC